MRSFLILGLCAFSLVGCASASHTGHVADANDPANPDACCSPMPTTNDAVAIPVITPTTAPTTAPSAAKYVCPMHPEVVSDKPGTCPKCGMALVANPAGAHDAHH